MEDKYSIRLTEYFGKRITGISIFHKIIKGVTIIPEISESYGKDYCRVLFDVNINEKDINNLSYSEQELLNEYFSNSASISGHAFVSYPITLNKGRNENFGYAKQLSRFKEFYNCYNALTSIVVELCINLLNKNVKIDVRSLDNFPEFNYMQKAWNDFEFTLDSYEELYSIRFSDSVYQHKSLISIHLSHIEFFEQNPERLLITDAILAEEHIASIASIRWFVIRHNIPIQVNNLFSIDAIWIDAENMLIALNKNSNEESEVKPFDYINIPRLKELINNLIQNFSTTKKKTKNAIIASNIILTKNGKLIYVQSVDKTLPENSFIGYELKINLEKGKRLFQVYSSNVERSVAFSEYQELKEKYSWKHKERVIRWLIKNKNPLPK
jgi:hypothetical protein